MNIVYSNRRKTYRYPLNIHGIITLVKNINISEPIEIGNISYAGLQVVFSNNHFLIDFFDAYEDNDYKVIVEFEYNGIKYFLENNILWIRLYNLGEKDSYVLSGLGYINKEGFETSLIDLLLTIDLEKVYIG